MCHNLLINQVCFLQSYFIPQSKVRHITLSTPTHNVISIALALLMKLYWFNSLFISVTILFASALVSIVIVTHCFFNQYSIAIFVQPISLSQSKNQFFTAKPLSNLPHLIALCRVLLAALFSKYPLMSSSIMLTSSLLLLQVSIFLDFSTMLLQKVSLVWLAHSYGITCS